MYQVTQSDVIQFPCGVLLLTNYDVIISDTKNCLTLAAECSFFRILCRVIFTNKVEFVWRFPKACRDKCFSQSWLFNFLRARGDQECVFILTRSTMVGITNLCYGCANKGTHRSRIAATLLTHCPLLPNDRGGEDINQPGHRGFLWRRVRATQINIVNHSAGKF